MAVICSFIPTNFCYWTIIAVGKKEVSERTVSVRRLGSDDTSILPLDDFTCSVLRESLAPNK